MKYIFLQIISRGVKDNTYKFALAKFLLDFSNQSSLKKDETITYNEIAKKFLEYYWYQECKYKLKQDFKIQRTPVVLSIIRQYCGTNYIPESYDKYFKNRSIEKEKMISEIENGCLQDVIPRFQNRDCYDLYKHYHTLSDSGRKFRLPHKDKRHIVISLETQKFLKENYYELSKILIYEWAKFLEKTNFTPKLISKIEELGTNKRRSLAKYKKILLEIDGPKCFYCNSSVNEDDIHIDHFIPWSYIYEDSIWNLVISCSKCNLKKSDNLPPAHFIKDISIRNDNFELNEYKKDINEYYINCQKSGFTTIEVI